MIPGYPTWYERDPRPFGEVDLARSIVYVYSSFGVACVAALSIAVLTGFAGRYPLFVALSATVGTYALGVVFRARIDRTLDGINWSLVALATTFAGALILLGINRDVHWIEGVAMTWYGAMLGMVIITSTSFLDFTIVGLSGAVSGQAAAILVPAPVPGGSPSTFSLAVSITVGTLLTLYVFRTGPGGVSGSGIADVGLLGFIWQFMSFSEFGKSTSFLDVRSAIIMTALILLRAIVAIYNTSNSRF